MPKKPFNQIPYDQEFKLKNDEIECAFEISQAQLNGAKIYSNREGYINNLPKNIDYMELGVAWGYYSELIAEQTFPVSITLVDWYNQDLKCWSWRKFGECQCTPKHEYKYSSESHENYIKKMFSKYKNVDVIKGDAREIVPLLNKKFDYVYIDLTNDRFLIRDILKKVAPLIKENGIIGLNDYLIYDGIIEDDVYGTFQSANEFLKNNIEWSVDGIALHPLGFYDIYLRKNNVK